jgi:hypothetical protein
VINVAYNNGAADRLPLEMTLKAKGLITLLKEALVHRAMRPVTDSATFAHGFVFINVRSTLRRVTLKADVVTTYECRPTAVDLLRHRSCSTFHDAALVWLVTVRTTHFPFHHRVTMR